jgi:hypothetical protein
MSLRRARRTVLVVQPICPPLRFRPECYMRKLVDAVPLGT